jgi:hypothetical protein
MGARLACEPIRVRSARSPGRGGIPLDDLYPAICSLPVQPFFLFCGPNVLQGREHALRLADRIARIKDDRKLEVLSLVAELRESVGAELRESVDGG